MTDGISSVNDELRIANAELMAWFDAAVDGIVIIDDTGHITQFNKAAEAMFGYSGEEIVGQAISSLMTEGDAQHYERHIKHKLPDGRQSLTGAGREIRGRRRSGTVFPAFLAVGEARIRDGTRYVGLIRDLSAEKRQAQNATRQYEQMMAVSRLITAGEMASTLAHELNQPLGAITNYSSACIRLLEHAPDNLAPVKLALKEIENQAHRAGDTIRQIRKLATRRDPRKSRIVVSNVIDEVRPIAERDVASNNVALQIRLQDDLPSVVADPQQIQQVLLQLIRNAVEAMRATPLDQRHIRLSAHARERDWVSVSVTDRGHGVLEEHSTRIFDPFFTTKSAGTGMGLAICQSLLEAHGARLQYTNNEDSGVTFFFNLPAAG